MNLFKLLVDPRFLLVISGINLASAVAHATKEPLLATTALVVGLYGIVEGWNRTTPKE